MRIAIAQMACRVGDVDANLSTIVDLVTQAADGGCDLVVFPEMADTGYDMAAIHACATVWASGSATILAATARRHGIAIACGLAERDHDGVYNAVGVFDSSGNLVGKYRKMHLFTTAPVCEQDHLGAGHAISLVRLGGFTLGIMICYDLRFPELARMLALGGAELIIAPAAWPANRVDHWKLLSSCRAIENQLYVAACNRAGQDGPLTFGGCSRLVDPYGTVLAEQTAEACGLLIGDITHEQIERTRRKIRVFDDRRPELYASLTASGPPQARDRRD